jgi:hypothetical protein
MHGRHKGAACRAGHKRCPLMAENDDKLINHDNDDVIINDGRTTSLARSRRGPSATTCPRAALS